MNPYNVLMLAAIFWAAASIPLSMLVYAPWDLPEVPWHPLVQPAFAIAPSQPPSIADWAAKTTRDPDGLEPWMPAELVAPRVSAGRQIAATEISAFEAAIRGVGLAEQMKLISAPPPEPVADETWAQIVLALTGSESTWDNARPLAIAAA